MSDKDEILNNDLLVPRMVGASLVYVLRGKKIFRMCHLCSLQVWLVENAYQLFFLSFRPVWNEVELILFMFVTLWKFNSKIFRAPQTIYFN